MSSTLEPGQSLTPGQSLSSDNQLYSLWMQTDGNVVLCYGQSPNAALSRWASQTRDQFTPGELVMQTDGNLVLYDTSGQAHWNSNTSGNPGAFLDMQDDGNVVVYPLAGTTAPALWSTGTSVPVSLQTVVYSGAMLNVGDANLSNLAYNMPFGSDATPSGRSTSYTEQGSWSSVSPAGCSNSVTVTATIDATWDSGPDWTWQDLQAGFASALQAAMQAASNPTAYQNYSYTEYPAGDTFGGGGVVCADPQPSDLGYYIPPQIQVTAYSNSSGTIAGQVTLTYSTDQSGGDVGDACDAINDLDGVLAIFPETAPLAAVVGAATGIACDALGD